MQRMMRNGRNALAMAAALVVLPGCASMGGVLGDMGYPDAHGDVLEGEVRRVDAHRGRLDVRGWDGRTRSLNVHRDTRVRYDRRDYPVSALERGDEVRVYVTVDRYGDAWADRVDVRRSVRERDDRYHDRRRVTRLEGTVRRMDLRDGWFVVDPRGRGRDVVVYLPRDLDPREERRLRWLDRGDRVRMDVVALGRDEAELVRFR